MFLLRGAAMRDLEQRVRLFDQQEQFLSSLTAEQRQQLAELLRADLVKFDAGRVELYIYNTEDFG
jgi:hypothetical protein